jgi:hypothetical protein
VGGCRIGCALLVGCGTADIRVVGESRDAMQCLAVVCVLCWFGGLGLLSHVCPVKTTSAYACRWVQGAQ